MDDSLAARADEALIAEALAETADFLKGTGGQHISNLRQWLNEDRITNPNKMVSNEDILYWLEGYKQQVINEYLLEAKNSLKICQKN